MEREDYYFCKLDIKEKCKLFIKIYEENSMANIYNKEIANIIKNKIKS